MSLRREPLFAAEGQGAGPSILDVDGGGGGGGEPKAPPLKAPVFDPQALTKALQQAGEARQMRVKAIPTADLVRIATLPVWRASWFLDAGISREGPPIEERIAEWMDLGLVRREEDARGGLFAVLPETCEMARSRVRDNPGGTVMGEWRMGISRLGDPGPAAPDTTEIVADVGRRLLARAEMLSEVPRARLVVEAASTVMESRDGDALLDKVNHHLEIAPLGLAAQDAAAEALARIEAATWLDPLLEGRFSKAIRLLRGRVDLFLERCEDERRLGRFFFERRSLSEAIERLMTREDDLWALHLRGPGGVGKTTFLRFLAARLAPRKGWALARVDFDRLHPDYPRSRPWVLAETIVDQIRRYDSSGKALFEVDKALARLREEMEPSIATPEKVAEMWRTLGFVQGFVDAIRSLGAPLLLVFDTCEELARIEINPDRTPPSVRAMFDFIEAVQTEIAATRWRDSTGRALMRVVFAGRRALPETRYTEVMQMKGFSPEEAESFAADLLRGVRLSSPDAVKMALLRRSATPEGWHNPFELALAAQWAREQPDIPVDALLSRDEDAYVRARIVGRVADPAAPMLPIAAALVRFDEPMIRAAWTGPRVAFDAAFRAFVAHEYVVREGALFAIEPLLAGRLERYFDKTSPVESRAARRSALSNLQDRIGSDELKTLTAGHHEALIHLLAREDGASLDVLDTLEWALVQARDDDPLRRLGERTLGEGALLDRAIATTPHLGELRARVLSIYASAMVRISEETDSSVEDLWREAASLSTSPVVACRARAGVVAACRPKGVRPKIPDLEALRDALEVVQRPPNEPPPSMQGTLAAVGIGGPDPTRGFNRWADLAASITAALEAWADAYAGDRGVLERSLRQAARAMLQLASRILRWDTTPALQGFALSLIVRIRMTGSALRPAAMQRCTSDLLHAIHRSASTTDTLRWRDFRAPGHVPSRIRLEYLRFAMEGNLPFREAWTKLLGGVSPRVTREGPKQERSIDQERLISAMVLADLASGTGDVDLSELQEAPDFVGPSDPVRPVHRVFKPAIIALAEGLAAKGRVGDAVSFMEARAKKARAERNSSHLNTIDFLLVKLALRMRLTPSQLTSRERPQDWLLLSNDPEDWEVGFAVSALTRPRMSQLSSDLGPLRESLPAWQHARARAETSFHYELSEAHPYAEVNSPILRLHVMLDAAERYGASAILQANERRQLLLDALNTSRRTFHPADFSAILRGMLDPALRGTIDPNLRVASETPPSVATSSEHLEALERLRDDTAASESGAAQRTIDARLLDGWNVTAPQLRTCRWARRVDEWRRHSVQPDNLQLDATLLVTLHAFAEGLSRFEVDAERLRERDALDPFRLAISLDEMMSLRVGKRRAALIALDEGELLALRQPHLGIYLLEYAERLFSESNDPLGSFLTNLSAAMAELRISGDSPAWIPLTRNDTLETLKGRYENLRHSLGTLRSWEFVTDFARHPNPEQLRLITADPCYEGWLVRLILYLRPFVAAEEGAQRGFRTWVRGVYGDVDGQLPFELAELVRTTEERFPSKHAEALHGHRADLPLPRTLLLELTASRKAAHVEEALLPADVRVETKDGSFALRGDLGELRRDAGASERVRQIAEEAERTRRQIGLVVEPSTAVFPWERTVALSKPNGAIARIVRTVHGRLRKRQSLSLDVVHFHAGERRIAPLVEAWRDGGVTALPHVLPPGQVGRVDVIHVLGGPSTDSRGAYFQFLTHAGFEVQIENVSQPTTPDMGSRFTTEELAARYPGVSAMVLQSPPSAEFGTSTDDRQSALLRLLALELLHHRVPLVVVIPSLPENLAVDVIRALGEHWSCLRPPLPGDTAAALQRTLLRGLPLNRRQVAYDLCIFALDPEWRSSRT